jgi:hypothetical protein
MAKTPTTPHPAGQGSAGKCYEAAPRTSGTPRVTSTSGRARMVNRAENAGSGTRADGTTVRRPRG